MAYPFYPNYYYPQQQTYNPNSIIWVSGLQEAQMYPVAPNNAVALWARDGKTIFLKQADATGKPSMKTYDLVERSESASGETSAPEVKSYPYATKDELRGILSALKGYDEEIKSVKSEIEKMSGDLYGLAGKKKAAKKTAEVSADDE